MESSAIVNWAICLPELVWFSICEYLVLENEGNNLFSDIARLSATCRPLYNLLWSPSSTLFWCYLLSRTKCLPRPIIDQIFDLLRQSGGGNDNPLMHRRLFAKRRKRQARIYRATFIERQQDLSGRIQIWFRSSFASWVAPSRENIRGHIAVERSHPSVQLLLKRRLLSTGLLQLYFDRFPHPIPVQALAVVYMNDRRRRRVDEHDMRVVDDLGREPPRVNVLVPVDDYISLGLLRVYKEDIHGLRWSGLIVRRPFINLLPGRYELVALNMRIERRCADENDCKQNMKVLLLADRGKAFYHTTKKNNHYPRIFNQDWFARRFAEHGQDEFSVSLATLELADMSNVYLGLQFWAFKSLCFAVWIEELQLRFVDV